MCFAVTLSFGSHFTGVNIYITIIISISEPLSMRHNINTFTVADAIARLFKIYIFGCHERNSMFFKYIKLSSN